MTRAKPTLLVPLIVFAVVLLAAVGAVKDLGHSAKSNDWVRHAGLAHIARSETAR